VWMRLLTQVEGSVLWLLDGNSTVAPNLRREARQRGISPERLIFAPRLGVAHHLARYRLADLFLDTLPVNAHTTASDALWVGLPVLTCLGNAFVGRVAAGLLHAVGLPELVAHNLAQYEQIALNLANVPEQLQAVREKLLKNRKDCPLFNLGSKRDHLETAYLEMHSRTAKGLPPASFEITP
jgi:protein O-GlcNAc transferase